MSYQPYPTGSGSNYEPYRAGGGSNMAQQGSRPPRPRSVRIAAILMYVGAGLSAVSLIVTLALTGRIRSAVGTALRKTVRGRALTAAQIHTDETIYVAGIVVVLVIVIGLWVWMAWANGRGKGWARIVSSVFFGLDTLLIFLSLTRATAAVAYTGVIWLVGLTAIILLWRRESTQYIQQQSQFPQ